MQIETHFSGKFYISLAVIFTCRNNCTIFWTILGQKITFRHVNIGTFGQEKMNSLLASIYLNRSSQVTTFWTLPLCLPWTSPKVVINVR